MKRFLPAVLAAFGLYSGCTKSGLETPAEFTREYAEAFRKASAGTKVEIIKDLELKITPDGGNDFTVFLDNAYDNYKPDPKSKDDIINRYVASSLETISGPQKEAGLDPARIVPVIKDRAWLEDTRKALLSRGAKSLPENVYEEYNSDLIILYAEDSPKNISYFKPEDLEKAHINRSELRSLACDNLKRLLPKIEQQGGNGLFMVTAGGDYESSLLLFDSIWQDFQKEVRGDVIAAIPTRDLLLVTGSKDQQGIEHLKQMVQKASAEGSYRLTTNLFVYRNGKFLEVFNQAAN